jgi:hypothetical protein
MKYSLRQLSILLLLCTFVASNAAAQDVYNSSGSRVTNKKRHEKKGFDLQRLVVGGGIGLGFGDITNISVSPIVGYRITDDFAAGVGLGFQYFRVRDQFPVYNQATTETEYYPLKSTFFYPSVWARYIVYKNFFVHLEGEYDMQSFTAYERASDPNGDPVKYKLKYNSPAALVGAGIRQPITDRASLVIVALYDVLQHEYSPYRNRIDLRIGFNVGF